MARALREWFLRLWESFRRRRSDADLEDELRLHLELAGEHARRRDQSPNTAARAARLHAGGVSQAMDALRDQRGLPWIDAAMTSCARVPRLVIRHRGYFTFATATVALAVGINVVVFTVVNALWLRPLPFPNPDRLVTIVGSQYFAFSAPPFQTFEAVAGQVADAEDLTGLRPQITLDQVGHNLETLAVTSGYFGLLGLPIRGRDFGENDDRTGAEPVAIISDRLWSLDFGRRNDLIGSVVAAKPVPIRVIGVAPPGFQGARRGERADVWIPAALVPRVVQMSIDWSTLPKIIFARLFPGQTAAEAERRFRNSWTDKRAFPGAIVPLKEVFGAPESPTAVIRERNAVSVVAGMAMLVLVGGCVTLTALVLVHYERRRHELAVKLALGASRPRIVAELLCEIAVVAVCGTAGSVLLAERGLRAIPPLTLPGGVDLGRLDLSIDWRVLAGAIAAAALTLLAATWVPIARFTRTKRAGELFAGPAATPSVSSQRVRQALLGLLVCANIVVLVSAGLFVRAVIHGFGSAPGFDVDRTVFATVPVMSPLEIHPLTAVMKTAAERTASVREALRSLPGVECVADGRPPIDPELSVLVSPIAVEAHGEQHEMLLGRLDGGPQLLSALGVPVLAGRGLTVADGPLNPLPAVVTASLATRLWPGETALGQVLRIPALPRSRLLIVGIARDFVVGSLARPAAGVIVTASSDFDLGINPKFVVRTAHPEGLLEPIRKVVRQTLPGEPEIRLSTGRDLIARDLGRQRLGAWFFSGFGLTALMLAVGGVFGLVAYLAESRQREFGVRLALGASVGNLMRHALTVALVPVVVGVAAGLLCAGGISRLFKSLLTGLSALDALTYVTVAALMLSCAALAALAAAWRLRRLAPTEVLRAN